MLKFRHNMDDHARDVYDGDKLIGCLLWHGGKPKFATYEFTRSNPLSLDYMRQILEEYDRIKVIDKD